MSLVLLVARGSVHMATISTGMRVTHRSKVTGRRGKNHEWCWARRERVKNNPICWRTSFSTSYLVLATSAPARNNVGPDYAQVAQAESSCMWTIGFDLKAPFDLIDFEVLSLWISWNDGSEKLASRFKFMATAGRKGVNAYGEILPEFTMRSDSCRGCLLFFSLQNRYSKDYENHPNHVESTPVRNWHQLTWNKWTIVCPWIKIEISCKLAPTTLTAIWSRFRYPLHFRSVKRCRSIGLHQMWKAFWQKHSCRKKVSTVSWIVTHKNRLKCRRAYRRTQ